VDLDNTRADHAVGHKAIECTENRALDFESIESKAPEVAWEDLMKADKARDLDDLKAVLVQIFTSIMSHAN